MVRQKNNLTVLTQNAQSGGLRKINLVLLSEIFHYLNPTDQTSSVDLQALNFFKNESKINSVH